jgi:hypothetical protein
MENDDEEDQPPPDRGRTDGGDDGSGGSSGADGGSQPQARARLEERRASIDSQLGEKTGAMQRRQLRRQREQIDAAMQQLQSGRRVAPEEIDRILGETSVERAD